MSSIMGLIIGLVLVFYGICVLVLPICVFRMTGTLTRCLQELKKLNTSINEGQRIIKQEKADAMKYIFKEGDYVISPSGQALKIFQKPGQPKLWAVTADNRVIAQGQDEFEKKGYVKFKNEK